MKKVVVGISGSRTQEEGGAFSGYRRAYVAEDYVNAILKNQGLPIILPMSTHKEFAKEYVDQIDCLLLSGGQDVSPSFYKEEPLEHLGRICPERDEFELALIQEALKQQKPILGICRGLQLLNVYFGGSLYQDQSYARDVVIKHDQNQDTWLCTHSVEVVEDGLLSSILGAGKHLVNSFHHQFVKELGQKLVVDAKSPDGVIEAFHHGEYPFVLAVQWHPEMLHESCLEMNKIFKAFLEAKKNGND